MKQALSKCPAEDAEIIKWPLIDLNEVKPGENIFIRLSIEPRNTITDPEYNAIMPYWLNENKQLIRLLCYPCPD
jgi:hypothetical protein